MGEVIDGENRCVGHIHPVKIVQDNPVAPVDDVVFLNIGDYVHIHDNYKGLDLDYYVLSYNEEKARKHFEEQQDIQSTSSQEKLMDTTLYLVL